MKWSSSVQMVILIGYFVDYSSSATYLVRRQARISEELDVSIGTQCVFDGRSFKSGTSIKDGCNNCRCNNGLVSCAVVSIREGCLFYANKESTTQPPNGCKFESLYRYDGEVFVAQDGCNKCWCNKGEIICPFEDDCENAISRRRSLDIPDSKQ